jgi:hypothetical protein
VRSEWAQLTGTSTGSSTVPEAASSAGKCLVLKMLHSQFKEFATSTRSLETLQEGRSADIDVALRAKLKTHAAEKPLHNITNTS